MKFQLQEVRLDRLEMEALLEMGCKFQALSVMFCIIFVCQQKCVYEFKVAQLFNFESYKCYYNILFINTLFIRILFIVLNDICIYFWCSQLC